MQGTAATHGTAYERRPIATAEPKSTNCKRFQRPNAQVFMATMVEQQHLLVFVLRADMFFLAHVRDLLWHLADVECLLAIVDRVARSLENPSRRVEILEEFWVRWRERMGVEILDDRSVEQGLLGAVDRWVVGHAGVKPCLAIAG